MAKTTPEVNGKVKYSIKNHFSLENVKNAFHSIPSIRSHFTKAMIFNYSALTLIVVMAIIVRLLPLRWGLYLTEFDPYWQYHQTQYVVNNGFQAWFNWHDATVWYPWGRDVAATSYPGLPFSAAALYTILTTLGLNITLLDFVVIWPVIFGAITIVAIYFLGKDIGGKEVGILASLFLALSAGHISRTSIGFFDDETLGVLTLILVVLFFLRSLDSRRSLFGTIIYGVAAGLSLAYLQATWGASLYVLGLLGLFAAVLVVFRRYSRKLLISYSITISLAFLIAIQVPRIGLGFLTQLPTLAAIGVALILCVSEFSRTIKTQRMKIISFAVLFIAIGGAYFTLESLGLVTPLVAKFWAVLNPFERLTIPLMESVAEHRPATWASFYYESGSILFIAPVGFYFLLRRNNVRDVFLAIMGITTLYFTGSLVRLTLILAPAVGLLAAVAVVELLKPFINITRERVIATRKSRFTRKVGREFGVIFIIITLLLVFPPLSRAIESGYTPTTIAASSLPVRPTESQSFDDWIQALSWMRSNLPQDAVVAGWWDYGYWITVLGNRTSLADNGTINSTQISQIGTMFLSNETQAIKILKAHYVSHVVVFVTWSATSTGDVKFHGFGEDGKWRWMARIAGLNETAIEESRLDSTGASYGIPGDKYVLSKLIWYGLGGSPFDTFSKPKYFDLVYSSSNSWVMIFKVNNNATG